MHWALCTVTFVVCSLHARCIRLCCVKKCHDLSNLHTKYKSALEFYSQIWHFVQMCPICGALFAGVRFVGVRFAWIRIVRTQFSAPTFFRGICWGSICHGTKKCGAQFAAKSARGPICLEPLETVVLCLIVTRSHEA